MSKKTILITGGNGEKGIGLGVGRRFSKEGWRVIILDVAAEPTPGCQRLHLKAEGNTISAT